MLAVLLACGPSSSGPPRTTPPEPSPPDYVLRGIARAPANGAPAAAPFANGPVMQGLDYMGAVELSDDGERLLVTTSNGTVAVVETQTGHVLARRRRWIRAAQTSATIDATGTRVLLEGSGDPSPRGWVVWNLQQDTLQSPDPAEHIGRVRFSPDGSRVFGMRREDGLVSLAADDPHEVQPVASEVRSNATYDISAEHGRVVALPHGGRAPLLLMTLSGEQILSLPVPEPPAAPDVPGLAEGQAAPAEGSTARDEPARWTGALFRPGGGLLVVGTSQGIVELRHPETGRLLHRVTLEGESRAPLFSLDGERILVPLRGVQAAVVIDPHTGSTTRVDHTGQSPRWVPGRDGFISHYEAWLRIRPDGTLEENAERTRTDDIAVARDADVMAVLRDGGVQIRRASDDELLRVIPRSASSASVWSTDWVDPDAVLVRNRDGGRVWTPAGARHVACVDPRGELRGRLSAGDAGLVGGGQTCVLSSGERRDAPGEGATIARSALRAVTAAADGTGLEVRDAAGAVLRTVSARALGRRGCTGSCLSSGGVLSSDGSTLFLLHGGAVFVIDLERGRVVGHLQREGYRARRVVPSHDGQYVAVIFGRRGDSGYHVLTRTGREVALPVFRSHESVVWTGAHTLVSTAASVVRVTALRGRRATTREYRRGQLEGIAAMRGSNRDVLIRTTGGAYALFVGETADEDVVTLIGEGASGHPTVRSYVTRDGALYFACVDDRVVRRPKGGGEPVDFGPCPSPTGFSASPDGRFVAMPTGETTVLWREDAERLRLISSRSLEEVSVMVAEDLATHRFVVFEQGQAEAPTGPRVLFRRAAALGDAPAMLSVEDSQHHDPGLLRRFLQPAAPPQP